MVTSLIITIKTYKTLRASVSLKIKISFFCSNLIFKNELIFKFLNSLNKLLQFKLHSKDWL